MEKFNTKIGHILGATILRELNAGHSQLIKQLNNAHGQLQAKEQEEVNGKECQKTGEVPTVLEDVLVIGTGNYNYVTKKQCTRNCKKLINVKDDANKTQPKPLVNAEDDANNTPLEPPLVDANDDANKNKCSLLL